MLKGKLDVANRATDIAAIPLWANPPVGLWQISYVFECTTPDAAVYGVRLLVEWADDVDVVSTTTTLPMGNAGRKTDSVIAYVAGGDITVSAAVVGDSGNPPDGYGVARYALHVRAEFLG